MRCEVIQIMKRNEEIT